MAVLWVDDLCDADFLEAVLTHDEPATVSTWAAVEPGNSMLVDLPPVVNKLADQSGRVQYGEGVQQLTVVNPVNEPSAMATGSPNDVSFDSIDWSHIFEAVPIARPSDTDLGGYYEEIGENLGRVMQDNRR